VNDQSPLTKQHASFKPFKQTAILKRALQHFSLFERVVFFALFSVMTISALMLLLKVNNLFTTAVPLRGGSFTEGVVGTARFINPVLAVSDPERDLTELIYSGLMRTLPNGTTVPDLAESYSISEDRKTYIFILKKDIHFSDNTPLTTDDIEFTILKIQDPAIKSPKRANWDGVVFEKINEREIHFILKHPYAPFIYNTTIGVLPKHIWKDADADAFLFSPFNSEPIGSGPYKVSSIKRNSAGVPTTYSLNPFEKFVLGPPYIKTINFLFFPNQNELFTAFRKGSVDSIHSVAPEELQTLKKESTRIATTALPRIFAVFLNQNEAPIFTDTALRKAFDMVIPKEEIVQSVFGGYAVVNESPLPPTLTTTSPSKDVTFSLEEKIKEARALLAKSGWVYNEGTKYLEKTTKTKKVTTAETLSFSLSTANAPELKKTADLLKRNWEALGVRVEVKVFEQGDLNQNVIRPRKYNALLFGEVIGRDLDLYAFWHSSQRNDPGLNVAMYTNTKTDKMLENARILENEADRIKKYQEFANTLTSETPSFFLYAPQFIYLLPNSINGVTLGNMMIPSERFANVYSWYIDTEPVWKMFVR